MILIQSNFDLRSPDCYWVRSYLNTTVKPFKFLSAFRRTVRPSTPKPMNHRDSNNHETADLRPVQISFAPAYDGAQES